MTSFDVVRKVRNTLKIKKAKVVLGFRFMLMLELLDPLANRTLLIRPAAGKNEAKQIRYFMGQEKERYTGSLFIGATY